MDIHRVTADYKLTALRALVIDIYSNLLKKLFEVQEMHQMGFNTERIKFENATVIYYEQE